MTTRSELFFRNTDLDRSATERLVNDTLTGCDDGELFLEYRLTEGLVFDDGRLKAANYDTSQGFGLRAVAGEATGYSHSSEFSEAALKRAADAVGAVRSGHSGALAAPPASTNQMLYGEENPLGDNPFEDKVRLLQDIDAYARSADERVRQVSVSLAGEWQVVELIRAGGFTRQDIRPLVRLNVSVVVGDGDRQESGSRGFGGRTGYTGLFDPESWKTEVDEAIRQAVVNLDLCCRARRRRADRRARRRLARHPAARGGRAWA